VFALTLNTLNQPLSYGEVADPVAKKGEAVVRLYAAALNHRDVYITQGLYAGIRYPVILGSDGAGEYRGKPVLINPGMEWGSNPAFQSKHFHILGMPTNGTFAEAVVVPATQLHAKPDHLSWEQAAALPLAGVTAWRALFTRCGCRAGDRVLISGIGGGAALLALTFAIAAGAEVWVTSGSASKIERAIQLGAKGGADYHRQDWDKQLKQEAKGFDVVIDAAAGDGFAALAGLCNPGARIGIFGGTAGKINALSPQIIFWKQLGIYGSTMGSPTDFKNMLKFVIRHQIVPVVDQVFPLEHGNAAFERMEKGEQFGKIVLKTR
jgi:NADPH:quinone reductase-like Zn-dependent oxidoreductase